MTGGAESSAFTWKHN